MADPPDAPSPAAPAQPLPSLTIALSGGGARCFAQLGVLDELLAAGASPVAATASSSSAFLAALWAAGHGPERIFDVAMEAVARMAFDVDIEEGLLGHGGLARALAPHLPERFEDLARPLAVVAIDVDRGERVVLDQGALIPALLASNAFPGLFTPIRLDGRTLIDGGGIEMVPVRSAQERWPHPVLAVDVRSPRSLDLPLAPDLPRALRGVVTAGVASVSLGWKSYLVTQSEMVRYHLLVHPPRWYLRPDLTDDLGLFRFDRAAEAVRAGRACARAFLQAPGGDGT